jgi:hypothetical protein
VVNLACRKAKELGYPHDLWTTRLLAAHVREHGPGEGDDCLGKLAQGTLCIILNEQEIKPYKVRYDLERRDPDFKAKRPGSKVGWGRREDITVRMSAFDKSDRCNDGGAGVQRARKHLTAFRPAAPDVARLASSGSDRQRRCLTTGEIGHCWCSTTRCLIAW